jgi:hypothetical protein
MKADGGGRIEEAVEVMHFVEAPEQRPFVISPVPPVDQEVQHHDVESKT